MLKEKIVQFVTFETILDKEQFIAHWEKFTRSDYSDRDVLLHQSEKTGTFKYLAKHRHGGGFKFVFERARVSSKNPRVSIKVVQEGGYSLLHVARNGECRPDEIKVFCFIQNPQADFNLYRKMNMDGNCNVYVAYYENCRFAYILEFFVKNDRAQELLETLKSYHLDEVAIYKELMMQLT